MSRILLIEDDLALAEALRKTLVLRGHTVHLAIHGREGMEVVGQHAFDLVVTDLIMPEQEGIETIVSLRRAHPKLPVIAMSGGGLGEAGDYLRMAKNVGAARVLSKPFNMVELLTCVEDILQPRSETV